MIRLPECPICGKPVSPATDPNGRFTPFCSRRCKEVDLVRWVDGRYAIVESIDPSRMKGSGNEVVSEADELEASTSEDDSAYLERE